MQYGSVFSHFGVAAKAPCRCARARRCRCLLRSLSKDPPPPRLLDIRTAQKGQCPVDLGSIGRQVSAAAVVQSPKLTDRSQSVAVLRPLDPNVS